MTHQEDEGQDAFSQVDSLTGLLSRSGFNAQVRELIDANPEVSYLMIYGDIDRFKVYNDRFGTAEGDELLADIGSMLRKYMPAGSIAARLRADHFVCCLPRVAASPEAVLAKLDTWLSLYREDFTFFVRLGIYVIDEPDLEVNLMCDRALLALRASKSGNAASKCVVYDETLRDSMLREQELAGEMVSALETGQFVCFFQPQYDYVMGSMIGAEVLVRWQHPTKGLLGPATFIPVFERTGLVSRLDRYVWELACRSLRTWINRYGIERVPRLSVNLSRLDIYRSDLCSVLCELVERFEVPFDLLHLEITESAYMESPEQLVNMVTDLRAAGFTVEMDDFGSGYSSLNTLKDVPVDVLKLDMGFLDAHESTRGGLILASVVRMARWLDLPTIAEGVETVEQAEYLASVGCSYMQGYLFSHPVDEATYEQMFCDSKLSVIADVAEEKERERNLASQSAMQQRLADAIPCGIVRYTVDEDARIVWMNLQCCNLLGYRDFSHYQGLADTRELMPIHEDDVARHREAIARLKRGSKPIEFTYRYYRLDGSIGWLEGKSAIDEDINGRPMIQSAFVDISDKVQKRHDSDMQRYSTVLCSVYEEIFEIDSVNGTFRMLYSANRPNGVGEISYEAAVALWVSNVADPRDIDRLVEIVESYGKSKIDEPIDFTYKLNVCGRAVWCKSTFLRISETSVMCCNKDVTEVLSAEDRKVIERVASTVGRLPVGIGSFVVRGKEAYPLYASDRMCALFGFSVEEYTEFSKQERPVWSFDVDPELSDTLDQESLLNIPLDLETKMLRKDGSKLDVRVQGLFMREDTDSEVMFYAVITDITEELRRRRESAWQNERYRLLSEMTHAISFDYDFEEDTVLLYIDKDGKGMKANVIYDYFETLSGGRKGTVHPEYIGRLKEAFEQARAGVLEMEVEYQADYYDRGYAWYKTRLFSTLDGSGTRHLLGLIENIDHERELIFRAECDSLTSLSNHAASRDRITAALSDPDVREHSVCVAIDVDDFKTVNDTCGHLEGDALLNKVGEILSSSFREGDIAGRVGGDEFVLLLKHIDLEVACEKLEEVRRKISKLKIKGLGCAPSVSAGVYATRFDDKTYRDAFVKSDEALYRAKHGGKNCIAIYEDPVT